MKYPQLVSMPSAVSDWLEEQLEARGIDAVVYTRYVLSLLHPDPHDLSDPDFIGLEQLEVGDRRASSSQTRNKRFRKGYVPLPSDQLRRTAAVQCLMSAAEQNVGIESLVDELCLRLRQIDNQTDDQIDFADKHERVISDSNNKLSPSDLARRYYAAFPALKGQSLNNANPTTTVVIPTKKVTWSNLTKKYNKSTNTQPFNKPDRSTEKFSTSHKHYPKTVKGQNCTNNIMKTKCSDRDRFPYFSRNKKSLALNISSRIMDKSAERAEGTISTWDDQVNWYNQANHRTNDALIAAMDEGYSTSDTITQLDDDLTLGLIDVYSQKEMVDDVEKLAAKFDRRIEAIWSPTHVTGTENTTDTLPMKEDDFQDLPVDFQELLASPTDQMLESAEIFALAPKPNDSIHRPLNFLQCGTNITSSIWSNQENYDDVADTGAIERNFYDQNDTSKNYFNVGKTFWTDENINVLEQQINANNLYESNYKREIKTSPLPQTPKLKYNNFSWEFNFDANALTRQKWSDGINDKLEHPIEEPVNTSVITPEFISSLMKLNHHKSSSAFSEIYPKKSKTDEQTSVTNVNVETVSFNEVVENEANVSEEDLLTSRKTHFCPIQLPDGFTFIVHDSPEHVNFRRTRSGTMFLESDADSPIEYMEFKRNCPTLGSLENESNEQDIDDASSMKPNFLLKFRVYKNEKYCQTEYSGQMKLSESPNEVVPVKRRVLSSLSEYDMIGGPGDENGNDIIANLIDNNECICEKRGQDCQDENEICWLFKCRAHPQSEKGKESSDWPREDNPVSSVASSVWGEHIWRSHEQVNDGYFNNMAPAAPSSLRDELSQEGDQLLSHISSLQRLYLFELSTTTPVTFHDDQRPLSSREERKRRHSTSLRSTHTLRWRPAHTPQALRSLTF